MKEGYTPKPPRVAGQRRGLRSLVGEGARRGGGFLGTQSASALENISVFIYRPATDGTSTEVTQNAVWWALLSQTVKKPCSLRSRAMSHLQGLEN